MMKEHILAGLRDELDRWEELLAGLSEEQITAPDLPGNWSIKDVMAHLMAWQKRTIARFEAAVLNREPRFPEWLAGLDPDSEESPDRTNAWIFETYRDRPWSSVYTEWREGYLRLLELGESISERDLFSDRYAWMKGYPLFVVPLATYEHHHFDHLEPLLAWLRERGSNGSEG